MRPLAFALMDAYPRESVQYALGWNLLLLALSFDQHEPDTAYLHARQAFTAANLLFPSEPVVGDVRSPAL